MKTFDIKVRPIGTSWGVIIPKEVMESEKIRPNESITVTIMKKDHALIDRAFGSLKIGRYKRDRKDREFK